MLSLSVPSDPTPAYGDCTCDCHRSPGVSHIVACCYPGSPEPDGSEAPDMRWPGDAAGTDAVIAGVGVSVAGLLERAAAILASLSQCEDSAGKDRDALAAGWLSDYAALLAAEGSAQAPRNAAQLAEYFSAHPIEPLKGPAPKHFPRRAADHGRPLDPGFAFFLEEAEAPAPQHSAKERGRALLERHRGAVDEVIGQARTLREEHAARLRGIKSPQLRALAQRCGLPMENASGAPAVTTAAPCAPKCSFYPDCRCGDEAGYRGQ